jgi:leucyl-tRNA synthetase
MDGAKPFFWVTNFSNRNVTLSDLNISIPAGASVNLLDPYHYKFTEEQLNKSNENGSIYHKKHLIRKRNVPPMMIPQHQLKMDPATAIPTRGNSIFEIPKEHYEELKIGENGIEMMEKVGGIDIAKTDKK